MVNFYVDYKWYKDVPPYVSGGANLVISAHDSVFPGKADYHCSGVDDQQLINYVLGLLIDGGTVAFTDGTFVLSDSIIIPVNGMNLVGMSRDTLIDGTGLPTNSHAIVISGHTNCSVRDMSVQTLGGGGNVCRCIFIEDGADNFLVKNVTIIDSDSYGIQIGGTNIVGGTIDECTILSTDASAIYVGMDIGNEITGLTISHCSMSNGANCIQIYYAPEINILGNNITLSTGTGIYLGAGCRAAFIVLNHIDSVDGRGVYIDATADKCVISGNYIYRTGADGMKIEADDVIVRDNYIDEVGQSAPNMFSAIVVETASRVQISGNYITDDGSNTRNGIHVYNGSAEAQIIGNYVYNLMVSGIHIWLNTDDCQVEANYAQSCGGYGIEIDDATCNNNTVKNNKLVGNATGQILDNGTNTQLATVHASFVDGSDPRESGYLINADAEYARSFFTLPEGCQQVVRIKVWARSVVAEADAMHVLLIVNGGAANEAYNTHTTTTVNKNSTTTNFAADDIIYWTCEEAEILALLRGDSVELRVWHEAAVAPDCATDAYFRAITVEYV